MANIKNFHYAQLGSVLQSESYYNWVSQKKTRREIRYKLSVHYHPYTDELIETLNRDGLPALLDAGYHESLEKTLTYWYTWGGFAMSPHPKEEIDVSDDGPAVSEEDLPHLFEKSVIRLDASPENTGLELALAKAILDRIGGQVWIGGQGPIGSTVTVCLQGAALPDSGKT